VVIALDILIPSSILLARFYRDPERASPQEENCIIAPADGIIKYVKRIEMNAVPLSSKGDERIELVPSLLGILHESKGYLVGISMNFLDVHVTRAPISGIVTFFEHVAGDFLSLKKPEAVFRNERLNQVIENDRYGVGLIHIASRLVRRIVPYVRKEDRVTLGQRIGMIRFGSQVDVILPDSGNLDIKICVGDKVIAGVTILASLRNGDKN
jgi:phosphatidylserine decarboxylase